MSSERTKLFDIPASTAEEIEQKVSNEIRAFLGSEKLKEPWKLFDEQVAQYEKERRKVVWGLNADLSYPVARFVPDKPRSVVVVGVGTATMRMQAEAKKIELTGIAKDWTITVEQDSSFEWTLFLNWVTPDRNTGKPLHLVYKETRSYSAIPSLIEWVHYALRYVFQHEADETILLTDGTRPFDPHT